MVFKVYAYQDFSKLLFTATREHRGFSVWRQLITLRQRLYYPEVDTLTDCSALSDLKR